MVIAPATMAAKGSRGSGRWSYLNLPSLLLAAIIIIIMRQLLGEVLVGIVSGGM